WPALAGRGQRPCLAARQDRRRRTGRVPGLARQCARCDAVSRALTGPHPESLAASVAARGIFAPEHPAIGSRGGLRAEPSPRGFARGRRLALTCPRAARQVRSHFSRYQRRLAMNALVVYDSQFGNTERIARAVAEALGTPGQARAARIDPAYPVELQGVDLL